MNDDVQKKALQRIANQETRSKLHEQEAIMEIHEGSVLEWAKAALAIREEKLFRVDYKTWEEYCKERWNYTSRRINQIIQSRITDKSGASSGNPFPDEDQAKEKLDPLEREQLRWRKRLQKYHLTRVGLQEAWFNEAHKCLDRLIKATRLFQDAQIRPPEPAKCRKCGADVLWVTTPNDKRMLLDAKPGSGVFEIINDLAVMCQWDKHQADKRYRSHYLHCSKRPDSVNNDPIPE